MRDIPFIEELLLTKLILALLNNKLQEGNADIDPIEFSIATKMLEQKLAVLTSLNVCVDGEGDEKVSINIFNNKKSIVIYKAKLKEAIMIQDAPVIERQKTDDDHKNNFTQIASDVSEEEFLAQAIEAIGPLKKTGRNTLLKESFIKVLKYTGDLAKMKNQ